MNYGRQQFYNLLRWSEKYFKTDMVYLFKGSFWLTLSQGLAAVASFLLAIAFANLLPKEAYGNYKYILSLSGIIGTLGLTGIGVGIVQAVARGYDGTLIKAFALNLKWSIFQVIIALGAAIYYFVNGNVLLGASLVIIGLTTPFLKGFELYNAYLGGKREFRTATFYSFIKDISTSVLIFLVILFSDNVILIVAVFFISNTLFNSFYFRRIASRIINLHSVDYGALGFGKHLSVINVLLNISAQLDKVIIFHYIGAIELAIYSFAVAIPKQVRGMVGMVSSLAMPNFSHRSVEEIRRSVPKKFFTSFLILGPLTVLYIIFAPFIYKILFPQYLDSVIYSQIYALLIPLYGNLAETALTAKKAVRERYILSLGSSLFNVGTMFILIHFWGILGIIISIVTTKYLTTILSLTFLRRLKEPTIVVLPSSPLSSIES